jgi:hypothetical protein
MYEWSDQFEDEIGTECSMNGEKRHAYRLLVGNKAGKTSLIRPIHKSDL